MKIGIIGNGFVGKATKILECKKVELLVYDIQPKLCQPLGITLKDICNCDLIFISVPTPMNKDGSCHIGIVESVINDLNKIINLDNILVVLRSTVPPGTTDKLNCYFMPEFLTEKNYTNDFVNNTDWIFGIKNTVQDNIFKKKITELINNSYNEKKIRHNNIHFVTNNEAEMIKLFRNNFLATKVSFCNEMNQFCNAKNIKYENVRRLAVLDLRIGQSHSYVPGHDGKFGYGGTCFPKDTNSMLHEFKKNNIDSYIINAIVNRNEKIDRPGNDWKTDIGRAVI